jgi:hypothetical protein
MRSGIIPSKYFFINHRRFKMKKKGLFEAVHRTAGMLAMALVFGMVVVGCGDGAGGGDGGGDGIPSELIGSWYSLSAPLQGRVLEFKSANEVLVLGQGGYTVNVSGGRLTLKAAGTEAGSGDYSIYNGEMTFTDAAGVMQSISIISPLVKATYVVEYKGTSGSTAYTLKIKGDGTYELLEGSTVKWRGDVKDVSTDMFTLSYSSSPTDMLMVEVGSNGLSQITIPMSNTTITLDGTGKSSGDSTTPDKPGSGEPDDPSTPVAVPGSAGDPSTRTCRSRQQQR